MNDDVFLSSHSTKIQRSHGAIECRAHTFEVGSVPRHIFDKLKAEVVERVCVQRHLVHEMRWISKSLKIVREGRRAVFPANVVNPNEGFVATGAEALVVERQDVVIRPSRPQQLCLLGLQIFGARMLRNPSIQELINASGPLVGDPVCVEGRWARASTWVRIGSGWQQLCL